MTRAEFAQRITAGLTGWLQLTAAQELHDQVGEDAARVEVIRMISALRRFVPQTSQRPPNWPTSTRKRVDIAILGKSQNASGWYGAIEIKWPNLSIDVAQTRQKIVEDIARVSFSKTNNLCANFLLLGGTDAALTQLFDTAHPQSQEKETQRTRFGARLSRDIQSPNGKLNDVPLNESFPDFGDRVPQTVFNGWSRTIKTELVASDEARIGGNVCGRVYIWQCKRR